MCQKIQGLCLGIVRGREKTYSLSLMEYWSDQFQSRSHKSSIPHLLTGLYLELMNGNSLRRELLWYLNINEHLIWFNIPCATTTINTQRDISMGFWCMRSTLNLNCCDQLNLPSGRATAPTPVLVLSAVQLDRTLLHSLLCKTTHLTKWIPHLCIHCSLAITAQRTQRRTRALNSGPRALVGHGLWVHHFFSV